MKFTGAIFFLALSCVCSMAENIKCCPAWAIRVVNEQGQPLAGCAVIQQYGYNFGSFATNFTAQTLTGKAGQAVLPERWIARTGGNPTMRKLAKHLSVHPEVGSWANIYVWKQGYTGQMIYLKHDSGVVYTTNGVASRVILKEAPPAK